MVASTAIPHFIERNGAVAECFETLAILALYEVRSFNGKAEVVCGPISTGGWGDTVINLLTFNHAIEVLEAAKRPMWNQMKYEKGLALLEDKWRKENKGDGYCTPILTEFYAPIFDAEPALISRAWFIDGEKGWHTSHGAQWEHKKMLERGIKIEYFRHEWHYNVPDLRHLDETA